MGWNVLFLSLKALIWLGILLDVKLCFHQSKRQAKKAWFIYMKHRWISGTSSKRVSVTGVRRGPAQLIHSPAHPEPPRRQEAEGTVWSPSAAQRQEQDGTLWAWLEPDWPGPNPPQLSPGCTVTMSSCPCFLLSGSQLGTWTYLTGLLGELNDILQIKCLATMPGT